MEAVIEAFHEAEHVRTADDESFQSTLEQRK